MSNVKKSKNVDLTTGVLWKQILLFVWPVFLSTLFQEIYSITNSMIAGNYISLSALSAVSACSSMLTIFSYMFYGISMGGGIVVANYFGRKDYDRLRDCVGTILLFALGFGLLSTVLGEAFTNLLFTYSNVSAEMYADANTYFRVYLLGNTIVLMYNMVFYVLQSMGDTRHPLVYLIISVFANIGIGMVLVKGLQLGVAGVALATILSQAIVLVLSLRLLFRMEDLNLSVKQLRFDGHVAGRILALGIPAAIQNMLIGISNMLIQSYINLFPTEAVAGIGVGTRVSIWAELPTIALSGVITSLVGQNMGAKQYDRIFKGVQFCNRTGTIVTTILAVLITIFAAPLVALFNSDPLTIEYGVGMTRAMAWSFIPLTWSHMYNAACRGAGNVKVPLVIAVFSQCVFRYLFVYIGFRMVFDVRIIYWSGALCYLVAGTLATLYYRCGKWTKAHGLRP